MVLTGLVHEGLHLLHPVDGVFHLRVDVFAAGCRHLWRRGEEGHPSAGRSQGGGGSPSSARKYLRVQSPVCSPAAQFQFTEPEKSDPKSRPGWGCVSLPVTPNIWPALPVSPRLRPGNGLGPPIRPSAPALAVPPPALAWPARGDLWGQDLPLCVSPPPAKHPAPAPHGMMLCAPSIQPPQGRCRAPSIQSPPPVDTALPPPHSHPICSPSL